HYIHGPDPELYDLAADPGETENLVREDRRATARLRDALERFDFRFEPPAPVEPETRSRLAALGYLGGARTEGEGPLPDPKSKLPVLHALGEAFDLLERGGFAEAEERYRAIVRREPQIVDAWRFLGHSLLRQGRPEEALEAYRRASALTSGAPEDALSTAEALLSLQRIDEAERQAELALEALPADAQHLLALASFRRGDLDAAERHAERALELQDERLLPRITLARIALARDQPERALELTDQVLQRVPGGASGDRPLHLLRGVHRTRGEALAQMGRAEEAERAFLDAIRLFPEDLAAYTRLALLYTLTGRTAAVGQVLRRMLEVNPTPEAYAEAARTLRVLGDPGSADRLLREARDRWPGSETLRRDAG
ncbi:MAG: tetratricopeptide repeat protein, partial [Acidobacteriota bacterium]